MVTEAKANSEIRTRVACARVHCAVSVRYSTGLGFSFGLQSIKQESRYIQLQCEMHLWLKGAPRCAQHNVSGLTSSLIVSLSVFSVTMLLVRGSIRRLYP